MTMEHFDPPGRFVAGTVGPVGQRAFYLQVSDATRLITVAVEKEQVSILSDRIVEILEQLAPSAATDAPAPDTDPLQTPFDEDWAVRTLALSWNEERGVMVIECHDHDPDEAPAAAAEDAPAVPTDDATVPGGFWYQPGSS